MAGLLFAAGIINYADRAALGIAAPLISKDLGLSPSSLGVVFSTFFVGYALFAFVGGQLADRYGPRRVYIWAATGWSLLSALTVRQPASYRCSWCAPCSASPRGR